MIASLYIGSKTFTHNGTDTDRDIFIKLVDLHDLIERLRYTLDNVLYINSTDLSETQLLSDGSTIGDINSFKREINRDVRNIFLTLFRVCKNVNLSIEDLLEYLTLEDEDNCNAIVVFNRTDQLPASKQVISNISGWLEFRRFYLGKYPKTTNYFIAECSKYYDKLVIHPNNSKSMKAVVRSHSRKLVKYLAVLNDHFIEELQESREAYPQFINSFGVKHNLDGSSLEGTKDKKFNFIFYKDTPNEFNAYCESHLKIYKNDKEEKGKHCRIYFSKPDINVDSLIFVGYIGEHL